MSTVLGQLGHSAPSFLSCEQRSVGRISSACRFSSGRPAAPLTNPPKRCSTFVRPLVVRQRVVAQASGPNDSGSPNSKESTQFGYNRKDVIIIGVGITGAGVGLYYGLQATGMDPGIAGNYVQLIVVLGLCLGWVSTYLFRVSTKQMTYAQQLKDYEAAVMAKRLDELQPEEAEALLAEVEAERLRREEAMKRRQQQQDGGSA